MCQIHSREREWARLFHSSNRTDFTSRWRISKINWWEMNSIIRNNYWKPKHSLHWSINVRRPVRSWLLFRVLRRSCLDDDRSLIEQTSSHSSLVPSREVLQWKKALDQSEQQREQLIEEFQVRTKGKAKLRASLPGIGRAIRRERSLGDEILRGSERSDWTVWHVRTAEREITTGSSLGIGETRRDDGRSGTVRCRSSRVSKATRRLRTEIRRIPNPNSREYQTVSRGLPDDNLEDQSSS